MTRPTQSPGDGWPPLGAAPVLLLLVAAAACRWLAFPPIEFPIAAVAWLALFAIAAVRAASARSLLASVFVVELAWWLLVQSWVVEVSAAGYPALCAYLALWGVLLALLVRRFARWPLWGVLPVVAVGLDFLRGEVVLGGYPWYEAGQALAVWSVPAQAADLLGARGLTLAVALLAGAAAEAFRPGAWGRGGLLRAAPILLAVLIFLPSYGIWRLQQSAALPPLGRFLAIQTNLPIDNKIGWRPERQVEDVAIFARLTLQALEAAGSPPDLVAWPETMLPGFGLEPETLDHLEAGGFFPGRLFAEYAEALRQRAGVPLLLGSPAYLDLRAEEGRWRWARHFNSVYLLDEPDEIARGVAPPRYDKLVLTPFGETMPLISRWKWLESQLLAVGARGMRFDLDAGAGPVRFEVSTAVEGHPIRFAAPICFEVTVATLCRRLAYEGGDKVADLLVNTSNDGWLGRNDAARLMHLRLASLRAIETRVPMLRAVNTGYSAAIDSSGRVVAGLDPAETSRRGRARRVGDRTLWADEAGWVTAALPADARRPLAARLGDRWAWIPVAVVAWLWWRTRRR